MTSKATNAANALLSIVQILDRHDRYSVEIWSNSGESYFADHDSILSAVQDSQEWLAANNGGWLASVTIRCVGTYGSVAKFKAYEMSSRSDFEDIVFEMLAGGFGQD